MNYISQSFFYFNTEESVKTFFEQAAYYNSQDIERCQNYEKLVHFTIGATISKVREVRISGGVLCYLMLFSQFMHIQDWENAAVLITDPLILAAFQDVLKSKPKTANKISGSDLICTEKEKRLVDSLIHMDSTIIQNKKYYDNLISKFTEECNKLENYQEVMNSMEAYLNSLAALIFSKQKYFPNEKMYLAIRKILSVLPIGDLEVHFLGDFLSSLSKMINIFRAQSQPIEVINSLSECVYKTIKKDVLPFLYEISMNLEGKRSYVGFLLETLKDLMIANISVGNMQYIEYIADQAFVDYLAKITVYYNEDNWVKKKIAGIIRILVTTPTSPIMNLNMQSLVENSINFLSTIEIGDCFTGADLIHNYLTILQQLLEKEKKDINFAGTLQLPSGVGDQFHLTTITLITQYQSFGWLTRFLVHRHTKVMNVKNYLFRYVQNVGKFYAL